MATRSTQHAPRHIYGVDFSGGANAGKKIWIASGCVENGALRIDECRRAQDLPGSGADRDPALAALRAFIAAQPDSAIGLDFPFSLPRALLGEDGWPRFVESFPERFPTPESFRAACRAASGGAELKRVTDLECRTPFSPYNLRLYRQTYYGLRDVLGPLARRRRVCVLPMQPARPGRPWLLEICPASTLKRANLYGAYKGKTPRHRSMRARILGWLRTEGGLSLAPAATRSAILADADGDALDSVIAAWATFRAAREVDHRVLRRNGTYALEGYVYA